MSEERWREYLKFVYIDKVTEKDRLDTICSIFYFKTRCFVY